MLQAQEKYLFLRELYIEKDDFKEEAGNKFFRLKLGGEVRLKNAYIIKANDVIKDSQGNITEIHCTYSDRYIKKSKRHIALGVYKTRYKSEVREYDRLFIDEAPDSHQDKDFMEFVNPNSLKIIEAFVEPSLANAKVGEQFQFQRLGYFNVDTDPLNPD